MSPDVAKAIYASREPGKVLAARYGVTSSTVWSIRSGLSYTDDTAQLAAARWSKLRAAERYNREAHALRRRHERERKEVHSSARRALAAAHTKERMAMAKKYNDSLTGG